MKITRAVELNKTTRLAAPSPFQVRSHHQPKFLAYNDLIGRNRRNLQIFHWWTKKLLAARV